MRGCETHQHIERHHVFFFFRRWGQCIGPAVATTFFSQNAGISVVLLQVSILTFGVYNKVEVPPRASWKNKVVATAGPIHTSPALTTVFFFKGHPDASCQAMVGAQRLRAAAKPQSELLDEFQGHVQVARDHTLTVVRLDGRRLGRHGFNRRIR